MTCLLECSVVHTKGCIQKGSTQGQGTHLLPFLLLGYHDRTFSIHIGLYSNCKDGSHVLAMAEHKDKDRSICVSHDFVENSISSLNYQMLDFFLCERINLCSVYTTTFCITIIHTTTISNQYIDKFCSGPNLMYCLQQE